MRISDWSSDVCSSDLGVVGLTMALAAEMAPTVRVNSVSPGPIDTPMLKAEIEWFGGTQEVLDGAINRVPLKRFASRSEEHTSELQSLMRISYAVFCLKKKKKKQHTASIN